MYFTTIAKVTLTANVSQTVTIPAYNQAIIQNLGPDVVYVAFNNDTVSVNSWQLASGEVFPVPVDCFKVKLLSPGTPTVQVGAVSY